MDAAFTLALRLRSISTQIHGWKPDTHSLPLESRVAQIEHAVGEAVVHTYLCSVYLIRVCIRTTVLTEQR